MKVRHRYPPNWPTEDEPPRTRMGLSAYLRAPPDCHGGIRPAPPRSAGFAYSARAAVVNVAGMAAALSKLTLLGIYDAAISPVQSLMT